MRGMYAYYYSVGDLRDVNQLKAQILIESTK